MRMINLMSLDFLCLLLMLHIRMSGPVSFLSIPLAASHADFPSSHACNVPTRHADLNMYLLSAVIRREADALGSWPPV